jgi:hypothetical protein
MGERASSLMRADPVSHDKRKSVFAEANSSLRFENLEVLSAAILTHPPR